MTKYVFDTGATLNIVSIPEFINLNTQQLPMDEIRILVDTSVARTVILPYSTMFPIQNIKITIADITGGAGVNNITVQAATGSPNDAINGVASYVINSNYGAVRFELLNANEWVVLGGSSGGSTSLMVSMTYAQLIAAIGASTLLPGQRILLTDYATAHYIQYSGTLPTGIGSEQVNVGAVEPLLLTAISTNDVSVFAESISNPEDVIMYRWLDNTCFQMTGGIAGNQIGISFANTFVVANPLGTVQRNYFGVMVRNLMIGELIKENNIQNLEDNTIGGAGAIYIRSNRGQRLERNTIGVFYNNDIDVCTDNVCYDAVSVSASGIVDNKVTRMESNTCPVIGENEVGHIGTNTVTQQIVLNLCNEIAGNATCSRIENNICDTINSNNVSIIEGNVSSSIDTNTCSNIIGNTCYNIFANNLLAARNINYNNCTNISSNTGGSILTNTGYSISGNGATVTLISENTGHEISGNTINGEIRRNIFHLITGNQAITSIERNFVSRITSNNFPDILSFNSGWEIDNNSALTGGIWQNSVYSIKDNTNANIIRSNVGHTINNNAVTGNITGNSAYRISHNSGTGNITDNYNCGIIDNNVVNGFVSVNNVLSIGNNSCTIYGCTGKYIESCSGISSIIDCNVNEINQAVGTGNIEKWSGNRLFQIEIAGLNNGNGSLISCTVTGLIDYHSFLNDVVSKTINPTAAMSNPAIPTRSLYDVGLTQHVEEILNSGALSYLTITT